MNKKMWLGTSLLCFLLFLQFAQASLALKEGQAQQIGTDEENDLMLYTYDYVNNEIDYPTIPNYDDGFDELNKFYEQLEEEWGSDDDDVGKPRDTWEEIDLTNVFITRVNAENYMVHVEFAGKPIESPYGMLLFMWSPGGVMFLGLISPAWFWDVEEYERLLSDDSAKYFQLNLQDDHAFRMAVSVDDYDIAKENNYWRVITMAITEDGDFVFDMFDSRDTQKQQQQLWWILALVVGLVAIAGVIGYFVLKRNKKSSGISRVKLQKMRSKK